MKRKKNLASFTLFTAIMMAATFTACSDDDNSGEHKHFNEDDATLVTNDAELRSAITDGASIQLAIDIDLSNSTLNIAEAVRSPSLAVPSMPLPEKVAPETAPSVRARAVTPTVN